MIRTVTVDGNYTGRNGRFAFQVPVKLSGVPRGCTLNLGRRSPSILKCRPGQGSASSSDVTPMPCGTERSGNDSDHSELACDGSTNRGWQCLRRSHLRPFLTGSRFGPVTLTVTAPPKCRSSDARPTPGRGETQFVPIRLPGRAGG